MSAPAPIIILPSNYFVIFSILRIMKPDATPNLASPRQKNCRKPILVLMLVGTILGCLLLTVSFAPFREPSYQGKSLSEWIDELMLKSKEPHAVAAIRAMGTNAVPRLLKGLSHSYSPGRERLYRTANFLLHDQIGIRKKAIIDPYTLGCNTALRGFEALGPLGSNALPKLNLLLNSPDSIGSVAACCMGSIGPQSLPYFIQTLKNGSPTARYHALRGIGELRTNSSPAFPYVVQCLGDTNRVREGSIRNHAIYLLGQMPGQAVAALPILTPLLTDPDSDVCMIAAQAMKNLTRAEDEKSLLRH
jgi:hypothetical protein